MNIKLTLFTHLLIGISLGVSSVDGFRCYMCGNENERSCQDFETSKDSFIKECGPNNKGCQTEAEGGKIVRRTCTQHKFSQECYPANKVYYCFCHTDLCNDNITTKQEYLNPTDDEDLLEGSGTKTVFTANETPNITHKIKSTGAVVHVSYFIFFVSFIIFMVTK